MNSTLLSIWFESYTEAEIRIWLHLRAIEWASFPVFVSQPIIPVLLIIYPWYFVLPSLFLVGLLWLFIQYSFVSVGLAVIARYFVTFLKWPSAVGSSIYLFTHQQTWLGVVALIWPFFAANLSGLLASIGIIYDMRAAYIGTPVRVGDHEMAFAKKLGLIAPEKELEVIIQRAIAERNKGYTHFVEELGRIGEEFQLTLAAGTDSTTLPSDQELEEIIQLAIAERNKRYTHFMEELGRIGENVQQAIAERNKAFKQQLDEEIRGIDERKNDLDQLNGEKSDAGRN